MLEEPEYLVQFGDPDRQEEFGRTYLNFVKACENLRFVWEVAFRASDTKTQNGRTFALLTRMTLEDDFLAIILLCANGHSNGAKQILRAMFEKVATIGYLHKHPSEIKKFIDYSWIQRRKKIDRIGPVLAGKLKKAGQESIKEVKENAKQLKDRYSNRGWSDVGVVQMARDIGLPMQIVETGYYWGLVEAHPTLEAIINRLKVDENESLAYEVLPSLDECTTPLLTAHYLALVAIEFLAEHFDMEELRKGLPTCWDDFKDTWTTDPQLKPIRATSPSESPTTNEIRHLCDTIAQDFHPNKIILFGSHAYGNPQWDSDIDLLVIMPFKGRHTKKAIEILNRLNPAPGLDLLVRTPQQVEKRLAMGDSFMREIIERGKVLYEADHT